MTDWSRLQRPLPDWYADAKLGIFVHWGAYSVPAWAEPTGELGAVDEGTWFRHNAYAEWYANTIRFDDSPAREHHRRVHGDAPYDDFLDAWKAEEFDPQGWCDLFARAGARYVVPTTKHHDGIALWDAPGTGTRNTVHRGPRRDLVGELATAVRAAGLRFGVYYSGGLDWHVTPHLPVIATAADVRALRPVDAAYAVYAHTHVRDLVDRYRPDVLWNDIEWPDAGKHDGALGLAELFRHYYATVPDGVVNDRWGDTHRDFRTSEYQHGLANEGAAAWENCRGIGLSFGYNQAEDSRHLMSGPQLVRHLVDVVSRGGNLLLNVGPTASGAIPTGQRRTLEALAGWMAAHSAAVHGSRPLDPAVAGPSDAPWVRWTRTADRVWALAEPVGGPLVLPARADRLDLASAALADGTPVVARPDAGGVAVELPAAGTPVAVAFAAV
ncbi:alpha-L-fucosidase [Pseudonocardia kunmingensis]|uniref:alpha-L-fucosidase n=1 Tax=Pseudonocardia kunmingensis TaxID=630975 RepID=A0A543DIQ0_9PSEU|nr:alpha-L-fucosidase [Pseudonocardia kunmingensis]TQM09199.1 alpha-L-fucosidase [Pseudonocardia kunmingensis]